MSVKRVGGGGGGGGGGSYVSIYRSSRIEKKRSRPSGLSIWRDNLHGSCDKEKVRYGGQPWSAVSLCPDTALPCSSPEVGVNRREIACPASQVSTVPQRSEVHSGQAIHGKGEAKIIKKIPDTVAAFM